MKNIFRFLMAVAVLFTASCAKEDISSSIAGGEVEVTFTANLPELGTRAYGEGKLAKELTVKVFESNTNEALTALDRTVTSDTGTFTFQLVLLKGMKYDIVLWAQDPTCNYYQLNGKVVTMNYTGVDANDETRDAFYYYVSEFDPAVNTPSFSLTRPFAQLNAAVSESDMTAVNNSKVELTTSTVKVKTYTTLNIATGDVDGETTVEFNATTMPKEAFNGNYTLLSMNYILVPQTANGKMLSNVEFTFNATKNNSETAFTGTSYQDVPLKRNYRTNILGALLTKPTDFEVKIDADFFKPDQAPEELFLAAVQGGEVTLTEDVILTQPLVVESDMILDLNGKTITGTMDKSVGAVIKNEGTLTIKGGTISSTAANGGSAVANYGTLTVENTTINGASIRENGGWPSYPVNNYGDITLKNTTINGYQGAIACTSKGTTTLENCTINKEYLNTSSHTFYITHAEANVVVNGGTYTHRGMDGSLAYVSAGSITVNGGNFYAENGGYGMAALTNGKIVINGGNFNNPCINWGGTIEIYGGTYSAKPNDNFVAAGYKAVLIDNWYRVLPEVIADAAVAANVTAVTESTADVATALATDNNEATMFMWNDVAYIAKYGEVIITSAADEATTARGVVENATSLTSATVAEGVEVVGNRTFRRCANLETVVLPNTLTEIGPAVFQSCPKLANVTIPASVTTIGEGAFAECTSLTSINIPEGITRLEKDVFRNTGLTSVEFHAGVTYFGAQAFRDCKQLKEVVINAPEFTMEGNTFGIMAAPFTPMTIYVANAEMQAYVESKLTDHAKTYITVVAPAVVSNAVEFIQAVNNVAEGGTIIVGADFDFTTEEGGRTDNGGWWDGLGYSGDKSFTIDLNGKTIGNANDALNDYLFWFKNDGEKANTITIKNGTLDAGTTAYCALCTASSGSQPLTINVENVTLINNKSDGSTIKARTALTTVNIKEGTKIIGKNSYLGIECSKATVNIYEGAEIYMNGTASYNGCLVGVGGNGVINVYGGYGKGVKGGFIAMTSGGTINVAGGEWIANTDGTIGNNSNLYVLTAQSNSQEPGFAGGSFINVIGGTFRGGMDAWVLNNDGKEKAGLEISGGNFNANPTSYLVDGKSATEANGIWTVQ